MLTVSYSIHDIKKLSIINYLQYEASSWDLFIG